MVPDQSWGRDDSCCWSWIDKIDDLGPAATAQVLSDDAAVKPEKDLGTSGRSQADAPSTRMSADQAAQDANDILATAEQAASITPTTEAEASDLINVLEGLVQEIADLKNASYDDDDPEADSAAYDLVCNTVGVLDDMLATAKETKLAIVDANY